VTDTLPHYAIFLALSEYTKTKDKEKAKEELAKCDLSELESFNPNIKAAIKDIITVVEEKPTTYQRMSYGRKKAVEEKSETETTMAETTTTDVDTDVTEEM
jgi:hypothetical protein